MGVLMAWVGAYGFITARDLQAGTAPLPSEYVAGGAWFGALALLDGVAPPVGAVIAWGTLFALATQLLTLPGTQRPANVATGPVKPGRQGAPKVGPGRR